MLEVISANFGVFCFLGAFCFLVVNSTLVKILKAWNINKHGWPVDHLEEY